MQIDGDKLYIPIDLKSDDIEELKKFVEPRLEYIDEVGFEEEMEDFPASSALIAFLVSLKKTKPSIKIPMIDSGEYIFSKFGKAHWILNG
jgi:hypothetical protein